MPNPIQPSSFQSLVPTASGSTCNKFQGVFVSFPTLFSQWYSYLFNEDGSFTTAFQTDLCAINCATLPVTPGPGPSGGPLGATTLTQTPSNETVILSWPAIPGAIDYELARNTTPDLSSATLITTTVNLTFTDTTVSSDSYYYYWVQGRTPTSSGAFSPMLVAWASTGGTLTLPAPGSLAATTTGGSPSVKVTWAASRGASSYNVYRNTTNTNVGATLLGNSTTHYYSDYSGVVGTSYYYLVTATNFATNGPTANGSGVLGSR